MLQLSPYIYPNPAEYRISLINSIYHTLSSNTKAKSLHVHLSRFLPNHLFQKRHLALQQSYIFMFSIVSWQCTNTNNNNSATYKGSISIPSHVILSMFIMHSFLHDFPLFSLTRHCCPFSP
jgi:uncharacterized membrane protein